MEKATVDSCRLGSVQSVPGRKSSPSLPLGEQALRGGVLEGVQVGTPVGGVAAIAGRVDDDLPGVEVLRGSQLVHEVEVIASGRGGGREVGEDQHICILNLTKRIM